MGVFSKIDKASSKANTGKFLTEGKYRVRINSNKLIQSTNPKSKGHNKFVVSGTVVTSTSEENVADSTFSWVVDIDAGYEELALGDIKGYAAAVLNEKEADIDAKVMDALISEDGDGVAG